MAKKVAPKIVAEEQTRQYVDDPLEHGLQIPGISFRWINAAKRAHTRRMRFWKIVEKDTELGQQVLAGIYDEHEKFAGGNEESNMFHRGTELVLAWAPEEKVKAAQDASNKKADDRLKSVVKDGTVLRERYITDPRVKKD